MQALQASSTRRIQRKFEEASLREPRIWRPTGRRNEEVIELCEGMIDVTAALFNVNTHRTFVRSRLLVVVVVRSRLDV